MSMQGSGDGQAPAPANTSGPAAPLQPIHLGPLTIGGPAASASGQAQGSSEAPAAASSGAGTTGNKVIDAIVAHINALGQKLIADLQYAQEMAAYKDPTSGQVADQPGANALAAIIPLVQLIVNGPQATTAGGAPAVEPAEPHIVTDLEKARIIAARFQDPNFQAAIAPLILDVEKQVAQVAGGVLGVALPGSSVLTSLIPGG